MVKLIKSAAQTSFYLSYGGLPKTCWINIFFNLLNAVSVGVCFFLSLYFVDILHFNIIIAGLFMSSYGIGTVVGGLTSGKLCDKYFPQKLAVLSLILQSIAFFTLAWFKTYEWLLVILFILGVANYGFKTANNISMLSHCGDDKGIRLKAINISYAASNFGLGISGIIVGIMAAYGYPTIFYSASLILILSAISYFFHKQSFRENFQKKILENTNSTNLNKKILILTLVSVFFVGIIIAQLGSTYPVYVKDAFPDLATKAVSILFILDTVLIVLFQAPLSNYCGRFNTILVMGLGAFLMGLGMVVLSISSTFILAMLSCCIWTTGEMLFIPTAQLLCYENGNKMKKGQSMGIFQSTYAISAVVGPTIGGLMYSKISPNSMWYLSLLIGIVCLIFCVTLTKEKKPLIESMGFSD